MSYVDNGKSLHRTYTGKYELVRRPLIRTRPLECPHCGNGVSDELLSQCRPSPRALFIHRVERVKDRKKLVGRIPRSLRRDVLDANDADNLCRAFLSLSLFVVLVARFPQRRKQSLPFGQSAIEIKAWARSTSRGEFFAGLVPAHATIRLFQNLLVYTVPPSRL